jgi:hypothetical protein
MDIFFQCIDISKYMRGKLVNLQHNILARELPFSVEKFNDISS